MNGSPSNTDRSSQGGVDPNLLKNVRLNESSAIKLINNSSKNVKI